ncbi:MAG: S41 family peptidase [Vicinamibacterales bacterium]
MTSRLRALILAVSLPVLAFAVVGGFLGRDAAAQGDSYRHLRIFEDVVTLILNNYVEEVDVDKVMHGAMHGLADGLDPDSAYLDAEQMKFVAAPDSGLADPGLQLTRQYYLRVIAARDGSPAAHAGLRPGDYIRAIDGQSTRDTTVFEGMRLLHGKAGTKVTLTILRGSAAEPHEVELVREAPPALGVKGRILSAGVGYVRVAEFTKATAGQLRSETTALTKQGATRVVVDVRGTATGDLDLGYDAARLFVPSGVLGYSQARGHDKVPVAAKAGDGALTVPLALVTDLGTSGAAEVFAAALSGNKRATLVGERTLGRAGRQKVVKLPDGSGLLLTNVLYLGPSGTSLHERGVPPDVAVDVPTVDFGVEPTPGDPALDKAVETLKAEKKAA